MGQLIAPAWSLRTSSSRLNTLDAAVCLALSLREHGTDEAIRRTAGRLRDLVPAENRPQMSKIMRETRPGEAIAIVERIITNATEALGI